MYTSSDTRLEWPREGPLFELDLNKRQGPKTGPLFESPPRSLLKSGLLPLERYGTWLEWLGKGPLYKSVSNKCQGVQTAATIQVISGPLLNSGLGLLFKYGIHQTINGRLELVHLPSDLILKWHGERPLFQLDLKKCRGQNVSTIRVTPWAIIYVRPGSLGQVRHQCKSLSYAVEYLYQICSK